MNKYLKIFVSTLLGLSFAINLAQAKEKIIWAADPDANVPMIFPEPENLSQLTGCEYDLLQALLKDLDIDGEFFRNEWDYLLEGLNRKNKGFYDLAIGSLLKRPNIGKLALLSESYLIINAQLIVHKNNTDIQSIADCLNKKIGSLANSAPLKTFQKEYPNKEVLPYHSEAYAFSDLKTGRLDAFFIDSPIALYYGGTDPELKIIKQGFGQFEQYIAVSKDRPELHAKINAYIQKIKSNGELRILLEKWNLWTPKMAEYLQDFEPSDQEPSSYNKYLKTLQFNKSISQRLRQYLTFWPILIRAALITVKVSLLGMIVAMSLGLIFALGRMYGPFFVRIPIIVFTEIVRGTPILIQLLFIFYGLPHMGFNIDATFAGILGLGINYAAYEAEIYRAGFIAVPKSQMEAARALGMSQTQAIRHVILPQAFRIVIPPLTNDFISLLKDSSLVSMVTIVELTAIYNQLGSTYQDYFGVGIIISCVYLILGLPFLYIAKFTEKKLAVAYK